MLQTKHQAPPAPASAPRRTFEVEDLTDPEIQREIREALWLKAWVDSERSRGNQPN